MSEWTKSAQQELDSHLDRLRPILESSGADPAEVIEDVKRHVDEEIRKAGLTIVTDDDMRQILSRMGSPDRGILESSPTPSEKGQPFYALLLKLLREATTGAFIPLLGIALPTITIGIEITTRWCAGTFMDPLPTFWHVLLASSVPLANLLVWRRIKESSSLENKSAQHDFRLQWVNGFALGVASYYTLVFLPLLPISLFAIVLYGMGLLPMAPVLSLAAAILCQRGLRKVCVIEGMEKKLKLSRTFCGFFLAVAAFLVIEFNSTITRVGLQMAASDSRETADNGLRLLHLFGDEEFLLRACYWDQGRAIDLIGFLMSKSQPVRPEKAREIFYRIHGTPFNSVPPPSYDRTRQGHVWDMFDFDPEQGGQAVAGRLKNLWLTGSRIDGSIDSKAALSYLEWILVFKNDASSQHEARAQIALPSGGVVSRVTLWVNGEEREAAFAGRAKARQAYETVVRARRDPLLVTTVGPDRILVQCFPVPPGGEMKIRLGVTVPLKLQDGGAVMTLPYFLERNFGLKDDARHAVWIESKQRLEARNNALKSEQPREQLYAVRGEIADSSLSEKRAALWAARPSGVSATWTADPESKDHVIRQTVVAEPIFPPTAISIVVDGSASMREFASDIISVLPKLPEGVKFDLMIAADDMVLLSDPAQQGSVGSYTDVARKLSNYKFSGGQDNIPALSRAWDMAATNKHGVVLWIHGPQPVKLTSIEQLRQRWERRPDGPRLYEMQIRNGPNRIIEELDGIQAIRTIDRRGGLREDLERVFSEWQQPTHVVSILERIKSGGLSQTDATSAHLARLWAYDQVRKLAASNTPDAREKALKLAVRYRLVTSLSGAVVLESKEQYDQAGLEVPGPGKIPTIPEPEIWMLLGLVLILIFLALEKRRRACLS